ncbi:hypothetical protein Esi_0075_0071 [Ectocarpus siliculosus]|uniref:Uncharacterized protein n=1 Tax=Ectocarpus siliculosus TaxID=2880 RepID=D7G6J9_ECTSI|nr:hypothetical protein Esi_0075_0071 [Ectocarpus siliculosus]|eukprot:CBJ27584.1 hypothetical protein Esi_0075_0071 [Ectocarpus siliculosus]
MRRRLEEAASARAAEAQRDVVAEKPKTLAARRENAELVRAQSEACERRVAELRREQQALEILEAQGRQLVIDANVVRGERERIFRRADERARQRRAEREAAERRVWEVRGEGHATAVRAESVLREEGRSMRPVSQLKDPQEARRIVDKLEARKAKDVAVLQRVSAEDVAKVTEVAISVPTCGSRCIPRRWSCCCWCRRHGGSVRSPVCRNAGGRALVQGGPDAGGSGPDAVLRAGYSIAHGCPDSRGAGWQAQGLGLRVRGRSCSRRWRKSRGSWTPTRSGSRPHPRTGRAVPRRWFRLQREPVRPWFGPFVEKARRWTSLTGSFLTGVGADRAPSAEGTTGVTGSRLTSVGLGSGFTVGLDRSLTASDPLPRATGKDVSIASGTTAGESPSGLHDRTGTSEPSSLSQPSSAPYLSRTSTAALFPRMARTTAGLAPAGVGTTSAERPSPSLGAAATLTALVSRTPAIFATSVSTTVPGLGVPSLALATLPHESPGSHERCYSLLEGLRRVRYHQHPGLLGQAHGLLHFGRQGIGRFRRVGGTSSSRTSDGECIGNRTSEPRFSDLGNLCHVLRGDTLQHCDVLSFPGLQLVYNTPRLLRVFQLRHRPHRTPLLTEDGLGPHSSRVALAADLPDPALGRLPLRAALASPLVRTPEDPLPLSPHDVGIDHELPSLGL